MVLIAPVRNKSILTKAWLHPRRRSYYWPYSNDLAQGCPTVHIKWGCAPKFFS